MTTAAELEGLFAPISPTQPTGEVLRYDPLYDTLRELRREDDPTLPLGAWRHELKRADWGQLATLAAEALRTRSKDLQIAAWLAEAWINLHGFPGARRGIQLLAGLVRVFWDQVHPQPANGDPEFRLAPLRWANDHLGESLKQIPLTAPETDDAPAMNWLDWETSLYLQRLAAADRAAAERAEAEGKVTQTRFLLSLGLTPGAFYLDLAGQLAGVAEAIDELGEALDDRCGPGAVSLGRLRDVVGALGSFVERVLAERTQQGELGMDEAGGLHSAEEWAEEGSHGTGRISSRAEAFRRLAEAADYLQRTEPHSPVPYLVKRAVQWGNLSLAELLAELLAGGSDLKTIYSLLGIKRTETEG